MTVTAPSKPQTSLGAAGAATIILIAAGILALTRHGQPGPRDSLNPEPTASCSAAADPAITIQPQPRRMINQATTGKPRAYTLMGRWSNTALGVEITWVTDSPTQPDAGKFPYRSGTSAEEFISHGNRIGIIVKPLYPSSSRCGYAECSISAPPDSEWAGPTTLVENRATGPNTGVSCFLQAR